MANVNKFFTKNDVVPVSQTLSGGDDDIIDPRNSEWFDMGNFGLLAVSLFGATLTGALTKIQFMVSKSSNGALPIIAKDVLTGNAINTTGDYTHLELEAQEVAQAVADQDLTGVSGLSEYRYVALRVDGTATDVVVADFIAHLQNYRADTLSPKNVT